MNTVKTYQIREPGDQDRLLVEVRATSPEAAMRRKQLLGYRIIDVDNRPGDPNIINVAPERGMDT